jgi:hypothetical protein
VKFLNTDFSPASSYTLLGANVLLSTLFTNISSLCSILTARDEASRQYRENCKINWYFIILNGTVLSHGLHEGIKKGHKVLEVHINLFGIVTTELMLDA